MSYQRIPQRRHHSAHTLIELVAAMVASAMLLAGLASVMLIARQVAYTPSAAARRTQAADVLGRLADELRYATMIVQHVDEESEQTLEFVVSDRDDNGAAERIRYDWPLHPDPDLPVDPGAPNALYKTVNGHTWLIAKDISEEEIEGIDDIPYRLVLEPPFVPGQRFSRALVRLQTGAAGHSRVDAAIPLISLPQRLSAHWRSDFDTNPTAVDVDGSGETDGDVILEPDWIASGGATFSPNPGPGQLKDGVWYANGNLATNPPNDFTSDTIVEARCKNMSPSDPVDVLQINADRQGGNYAPLIVRMQKLPDGSQTLKLLGKPTSGSEQLLKEVDNLTDDYVRFRLIIRPDTNSVSLRINDTINDNGDDVLGGPFTYPTHSPTPTDRCVKIFAGPTFDYVEVSVLAD